MQPPQPLHSPRPKAAGKFSLAAAARLKMRAAAAKKKIRIVNGEKLEVVDVLVPSKPAAPAASELQEPQINAKVVGFVRQLVVSEMVLRTVKFLVRHEMALSEHNEQLRYYNSVLTRRVELVNRFCSMLIGEDPQLWSDIVAVTREKFFCAS